MPLGRILTSSSNQVAYTVPTGKLANIALLLQKKSGQVNPQKLALWIVEPNTIIDNVEYSDAYLIDINDVELVQITGILLRENDQIIVSSVPSPVSQSLGSGDGTTTAFSGTLSTLVVPGSVSVTYTIGGVQSTITDDGSGNISGTNVSGSVNYQTGAINLTFTTAPNSGTTIDVSYNIYSQILVTVTGAEV